MGSCKIQKTSLMNTFAQRVINFNTHLVYEQLLPNGFAVLNPYVDNPETMEVMRAFYEKFYKDDIRNHDFKLPSQSEKSDSKNDTVKKDTVKKEN